MAQSMSSAPFVWHPDGRPDWASMWTTFCDLALFGGPPQRGPDSALRAAAWGDACDAAMLAEMRRGIWETTGLYAESSEPGRLVVSCDSPEMARWMATAIALENVEAHADDDRPDVRARVRRLAARERGEQARRVSGRRRRGRAHLHDAQHQLQSPEACRSLVIRGRRLLPRRPFARAGHEGALALSG